MRKRVRARRTLIWGCAKLCLLKTALLPPFRRPSAPIVILHTSYYWFSVNVGYWPFPISSAALPRLFPEHSGKLMPREPGNSEDSTEHIFVFFSRRQVGDRKKIGGPFLAGFLLGFRKGPFPKRPARAWAISSWDRRPQGSSWQRGVRVLSRRLEKGRPLRRLWGTQSLGWRPPKNQNVYLESPSDP